MQQVTFRHCFSNKSVFPSYVLIFVLLGYLKRVTDAARSSGMSVTIY
jgi:hypothetical protein